MEDLLCKLFIQVHPLPLLEEPQALHQFLQKGCCIKRVADSFPGDGKDALRHGDGGLDDREIVLITKKLF
jgi:hypothetical protein